MSNWMISGVLMFGFSLGSIVSVLKKRKSGEKSDGVEKGLNVGSLILSLVLMVLSVGIIIKELMG